MSLKKASIVFGKTNSITLQINFTKKLLFIIGLLSATLLHAQTISMDQQPVEDAMRRAQLLGRYDSSVSFMLRPLQANDSFGFKKIDKHFLGKWGYATLLPVQLTQQMVTAQPFQELDGPMLASSGYQLMASAGLYARLGPLSIQLQPQYVYAANQNFRGSIQTPNYTKTYWGNSSIRLNAGAFSVGVSSENITWGPSILNPLLMSAHAPGFEHISFNSRRPLKTFIGNFEWQWVAGYLDDVDPKFNNAVELSASGYLNQRRRYVNGMAAAYQPKWIKGLSVGLVRIVQEPEVLLQDNKEWNLLFRNVARATDKPEFVNSLVGSVEDNRDQYASLFLRYVFAPAHAEFYTEWGRNDAFFNMRDFIQQPEHSRAYTYGFKKIFKQKNNQEYWQFMSEYTRLQQASTFPVRTAGTWYVHGGLSGYDQQGQILGAPSGMGGNFGMIRVSKFKGWQQIGAQLESTTHNADDFEGSGLAFSNPSLTKWVDYGCRIFMDYPFQNFLISATLAYKRSFNYNFSQPLNASGLGIANPNDVDSYLIKLTIRYR